MKKKIIIAVILASALVLGLAACTLKKEDNSQDDSEDTIGKQYLAAFSASGETSTEKLAQEMADLNIFEAELGITEAAPGYLDGFDADITAFTKGTKFAPYIGSIPFVGYVFETDDADALLDQLKANANPRWNICTEADETVITSKGNLVFFLMCSNEKQ